MLVELFSFWKLFEYQGEPVLSSFFSWRRLLMPVLLGALLCRLTAASSSSSLGFFPSFFAKSPVCLLNFGLSPYQFCMVHGFKVGPRLTHRRPTTAKNEANVRFQKSTAYKSQMCPALRRQLSTSFSLLFQKCPTFESTSWQIGRLEQGLRKKLWGRREKNDHLLCLIPCNCHVSVPFQIGICHTRKRCRDEQKTSHVK